MTESVAEEALNCRSDGSEQSAIAHHLLQGPAARSRLPLTQERSCNFFIMSVDGVWYLESPLGDP